MSTATDAPRQSTGGPEAADASGAAQAPKQRHVCPFCGTLNESAVTSCAKCTLMNTPQTRRVTRGRIGPWYVLQSRNPAAPGMKFDVLVGFIRKGQVTARSIVRGPTTHQFWRYAAHVRGVSREFGLCYACGADINTESHLCLHCGKTQGPPDEADVLLEVVLPEAGGRLRPAATAGVPEIVDAEVVRSEDSMMGVPAFGTEATKATRVRIEPQVEPVPDFHAEREPAIPRPSPAERAASAREAAELEAAARREAEQAAADAVERPQVDARPEARRPRETITIDSAKAEPVVTSDTFATAPLTEVHLETHFADDGGTTPDVAASTVTVTPASEPDVASVASEGVGTDSVLTDTYTATTAAGISKPPVVELEPKSTASPASARTAAAKQPAPVTSFTDAFADPDLSATLDNAAGTPFAEDQVAGYATPNGGTRATASTGETGLMSPADVENWFHAHFQPVAEFNHEVKREPLVSVSSPRFWSTTFLVVLTLAVGTATASTYYPAEREKAVGWMSVHLLAAKHWVAEKYATYAG